MNVANCEHGHPCRCYEERLRREIRDAYDETVKSSAQHQFKRERTRQRRKIHANAESPEDVNYRRGS